MKSVVIIGAGIGGIATANILAKAGYKVSVYEKNSTAGGRAGLLKKDGFTFDTGPSWYLMPEVFEHHFSLFGRTVTEELDLVKLEPVYKVFFESSDPLTVTGNLEVDAATFESIEPGAGDRLKSYIAEGDAVYKMSLRHFLYTNFTSLRDFMQPEILRSSTTLLRRAFMPIDRYVSKFVHDQRLKQILEYPMVFLGTSPFTAPAIYSLMSTLDFKEGVFYPRGGMYTIIDRLLSISAELGVTYHFNAPVTAIKTKDTLTTGIMLESGEFVAADIVISNADLHFTETKLLDSASRTYPEKYWQKREAGPSALLLYLGVKGSLPELEHHNLLFVESWEQNFQDIYENKKAPDPASIYVCKPSATDRVVAPKGHENVFVLVPMPPGISLNDAETEKLVDQYINQLQDMTGINDFSNRIVTKYVFGPDDFLTKFHAWQSTALGPSHTLGQSALFRTQNKSKKVKNLYYVGGSTTPGIGLPMCLIGAELIYKRLAGDARGGRVKEIKNIGGGDA